MGGIILVAGAVDGLLDWPAASGVKRADYSLSWVFYCFGVGLRASERALGRRRQQLERPLVNGNVSAALVSAERCRILIYSLFIEFIPLGCGATLRPPIESRGLRVTSEQPRDKAAASAELMMRRAANGHEAAARSFVAVTYEASAGAGAGCGRAHLLRLARRRPQPAHSSSAI